jgi:pyruvate kinase
MYIVATISKNSYSAEKIEEILKAGATVLRYNFSHGTPEEMVEKVTIAQNVIKKLNFQKKVKILADLPGDKMRLGNFAGGQFPVEKGQKVIFKVAKESQNPKEFIPVDVENICKLIKPTQIITLADGEIAFQIKKIVNATTFTAEALNTRHIPALKAINISRGIDTLNHITEKTLAHIERALPILKPEWIAFSFVNSKEYLKKARTLLSKNGINWDHKLVSKIESPLALKNIDAIAKECDILLVARGDLGLTIPIEEMGIAQKRIVKAAQKAGKQSIVSTQILDSLLTQFVPSRAEILDLTNIVLDGTDGIMLAKETGISLTPGYSVEVAKNIIETVEKNEMRIL